MKKASDKNSKIDSDIMEKGVEVDSEVCISCELCITQYPDVFEFVGGHTQIKKNADFSKVDWKRLEEIIKNCPVLALSLTKNEKGTK